MANNSLIKTPSSDKLTWKRISFILFYGSIWGIIEASLGYVLHFLPALISGSIMFPIVTFILLRAYAGGKSKLDLVLVAVITAAIKSINLFMPAINIWKTINPMICIVLESLMVVAVLNLLAKKSLVAKLSALPLASLGWNALYLTYLFVSYLITGNLARQIATFGAFTDYLLVNCLLSGILASAIYFVGVLVDRKLSYRHTFKVWLSVPAFALAVVLTIVL